VTDWDEEDDDILRLRSTADQPVDAPPELVRAIELQRDYWTYDADEQAQLESQGVERLDWRDLLRLHHLTCVQRLNERLTGGSQLAAAAAKTRRIVRRLAAPDSPFRPRPALVWKIRSANPGPDRESDLEGELLNPSLTHLGCLEIYQVDEAGEPLSLDFLSFDEVDEIALVIPPEPIRPVLLQLVDGSTVPVLVPQVYGFTWVVGLEIERAARLTRFVGSLDLDTDAIPPFARGMGIGQQDLAIIGPNGGACLVGIRSVAAITFGLDLRDPRFDEKARARGMDPEEVRRHVRSSS
jgi:hypothetical protein